MLANIAPLSGEGCVESIAIVTDWRFSSIKIVFDTSMMIISVIMCYFFYTTPWGSVNVETVISEFMVAFTLRQIAKLYNHMTVKILVLLTNEVKTWNSVSGIYTIKKFLMSLDSPVKMMKNVLSY